MNSFRNLSIVVGLFLTHLSFGQYRLHGKVKSVTDSTEIAFCVIHLNGDQTAVMTDSSGRFEFKNLPTGTYELKTDVFGFSPYKKTIEIKHHDKFITLYLEQEHLLLDSILVEKKKEDAFMRGVENMGIYEGKKSEVIYTDKLVANTSTNNARQVYSKVPGLNIYENDGAGLQLSIGGRGLDPNRTANFNVRQNGYDISADALGYPESYYTPPIEGVERIQIVRGAASLQYGTQFGGLVNFVMRRPVTDRKFQMLLRQTGGSYGFYNAFTSFSGTVNKVSYYSFFQYKRGDGWRPNSEFNNFNFYTHLKYKISEKSAVGMDVTVMDYLAKQPGGLTDKMFYQNPRQSNRDRNWFSVNWNLFALHFDHKLNDNNEFNIRAFGLIANRYSLGFRPNRVDIVDDNSERDLIKGDFKNWGVEARYLKRYKINNAHNVLLVGTRYYHGFNHSTQGQGSKASHADFNYIDGNMMTYDYRFPNRNLAFFAENIIYLSKRLSITPGIRYEFIRTTADGFTADIVRDLAGNVIFYNKVNEYRSKPRQFILGGVGLSYRPSEKVNMYANISQNYRSITFNDMKISNPSAQIDPDLQDEKGYSADWGIRSENAKWFTYDISVFLLSYNNRIGEINTFNNKDQVYRLRTNIGHAVMTGVESYVESNVVKFFHPNAESFKAYLFGNFAFIHSEYIKSEQIGVEGNKVEFVPSVNIKAGARIEYKRFKISYQYTYLSDQYTDAQNTPSATDGISSGIVGIIPTYYIMDISTSYEFNRYRIEASVNNLTNQMYFTRRATGYPGPGILPSDGRAFYLTLQVKI